MTLGEKIYKLRTKRSMTQEQLAEKIGVSRQSVSKWETDSAIPDIEKLKLLAEIFEVSITELLGMECEEDTKRKDEIERIEHCQKEMMSRKKLQDLMTKIEMVLLWVKEPGFLFLKNMNSLKNAVLTFMQKLLVMANLLMLMIWLHLILREMVLLSQWN